MSEYKHYVRTDSNGIVILGFTTGFPEIATPQPGDLLLDGYDGRHFQLNLYTERLQFKYKVVNGEMVERTQIELDAEWDANPPAPETDAKKIARLEAEKVVMQQQMSKMNQNFMEFTDFYFSQNPDQA